MALKVEIGCIYRRRDGRVVLAQPPVDWLRGRAEFAYVGESARSHQSVATAGQVGANTVFLTTGMVHDEDDLGENQHSHDLVQQLSGNGGEFIVNDFNERVPNGFNDGDKVDVIWWNGGVASGAVIGMSVGGDTNVTYTPNTFRGCRGDDRIYAYRKHISVQEHKSAVECGIDQTKGVDMLTVGTKVVIRDVTRTDYAVGDVLEICCVDFLDTQLPYKVVDQRGRNDWVSASAIQPLVAPVATEVPTDLTTVEAKRAAVIAKVAEAVRITTEAKELLDQIKASGFTPLDDSGDELTATPPYIRPEYVPVAKAQKGDFVKCKKGSTYLREGETYLVSRTDTELVRVIDKDGDQGNYGKDCFL